MCRHVKIEMFVYLCPVCASGVLAFDDEHSIPIPACLDMGCEAKHDGDGECVNIRGANWAQIDEHFNLNMSTHSSDRGLCKQSEPNNCCMCLQKKVSHHQPSCTNQGCHQQWKGRGMCVDVFSDHFAWFVEYLDMSVGGKEGLCGDLKKGCCTCFKMKDGIHMKHE